MAKLELATYDLDSGFFVTVAFDKMTLYKLLFASFAMM